MIHCENTSCKHYFEDSCMHELEDGKNMVCISKNNECETFEVGVNDSYLKVFKMNDYEWWCTDKELEEFYPWYLKEHGLDPEDNPLEEVAECDLDNDGMWWDYDDENEKQRLLNELGEHDGIVTPKGIGSIKKFDGEPREQISFRKAIQLNGAYIEPFCIASTIE